MKTAILVFGIILPPLAHAQAGWTVASRPILDVAGVDANGTVVFQNPGGATRLSNGSLLVADRGSTSIRLIDATGKLVKSVGRAGSGPGEYPLIISGSGCGPDSMVVWARDITMMIGASGAVARTFKVPSDTSRPQPLMTLSCASGGNIGYISQPTSRVAATTPGMFQMYSSVASVSRDENS